MNHNLLVAANRVIEAIHAEDGEFSAELAMLNLFAALGETNEAKLRLMNPRLRDLYLVALLTRQVALEGS